MYKPVKVVVTTLAAMLLLAACTSGESGADDEAAIANAASAEGQSVDIIMWLGAVDLTTGALKTLSRCDSKYSPEGIVNTNCTVDDFFYFVAGASEWMLPSAFAWASNGNTVVVSGTGVVSGASLSSTIVFSSCQLTNPSTLQEQVICTGGTTQPGDGISRGTQMTWTADSDSWRDAPLGQGATHDVSSSCEDPRGCRGGSITWSADGIRILEAESSDEGTSCTVEEDGTASCQVWGFRPGYTSKVTLTYEKTSSASEQATVTATCVDDSGLIYESGSACAPATVGAPGLSVQVIGPQDVGMGVDVDYAVYVTNESSDPVPGVNVTMSSNDGMVEVVSASGGDGWVCDSATMECTAESLAPGAASAVGFVVNVDKDWCINQGAIQAVGSATVKGAEPVTGSVDLNPWPCPGDVVVEPGASTAEIAVGGVMSFNVDDPGNWTITSSDSDVMEVFGGAAFKPRGEALAAGTTEVVLTNTNSRDKWTIQVTVTP